MANWDTEMVDYLVWSATLTSVRYRHNFIQLKILFSLIMFSLIMFKMWTYLTFCHFMVCEDFI